MITLKPPPPPPSENCTQLTGPPPAVIEVLVACNCVLHPGVHAESNPIPSEEGLTLSFLVFVIGSSPPTTGLTDVGCLPCSLMAEPQTRFNGVAVASRTSVSHGSRGPVACFQGRASLGLALVITANLSAEHTVCQPLTRTSADTSQLVPYEHVTMHLQPRPALATVMEACSCCQVLSRQGRCLSTAPMSW